MQRNHNCKINMVTDRKRTVEYNTGAGRRDGKLQLMILNGLIVYHEMKHNNT